MGYVQGVGILRNICYFFQRGRRGWADCDVWSLDVYLAEIVVGTVGHLRRIAHGFPSQLTDEKWDMILSEIVAGFSVYLRLWNEPRVASLDEKIVMDRAKKLLMRHFESLWD